MARSSVLSRGTVATTSAKERVLWGPFIGGIYERGRNDYLRIASKFVAEAENIRFTETGGFYLRRGFSKVLPGLPGDDATVILYKRKEVKKILAISKSDIFELAQSGGNLVWNAIGGFSASGTTTSGAVVDGRLYAVNGKAPMLVAEVDDAGTVWTIKNAGISAPTTAPTVTVSGGSGTATFDFRIAYSWQDANGFESNISPEAIVKGVKVGATITVNFGTAPSGVAKRIVYSTLRNGGELFKVAEKDNTGTSIAITADDIDRNEAIPAPRDHDPPPSGIFRLFYFAGRLYAAQTDKVKSRLSFSKLLDPQYWPPENAIDLNVLDSSDLIDFAPLSSGLLLIKKSSVFVLMGDPEFDATPLTAIETRGVNSERAVAIINGKALIPSEAGLFAYDGQKTEEIWRFLSQTSETMLTSPRIRAVSDKNFARIIYQDTKSSTLKVKALVYEPRYDRYFHDAYLLESAPAINENTSLDMEEPTDASSHESGISSGQTISSGGGTNTITVSGGLNSKTVPGTKIRFANGTERGIIGVSGNTLTLDGLAPANGTSIDWIRGTEISQSKLHMTSASGTIQGGTPSVEANAPASTAEWLGIASTITGSPSAGLLFMTQQTTGDLPLYKYTPSSKSFSVVATNRDFGRSGTGGDPLPLMAGELKTATRDGFIWWWSNNPYPGYGPNKNGDIWTAGSSRIVKFLDASSQTISDLECVGNWSDETTTLFYFSKGSSTFRTDGYFNFATPRTYAVAYWSLPQEGDQVSTGYGFTELTDSGNKLGATFHAGIDMALNPNGNVNRIRHNASLGSIIFPSPFNSRLYVLYETNAGGGAKFFRIQLNASSGAFVSLTSLPNVSFPISARDRVYVESNGTKAYLYRHATNEIRVFDFTSETWSTLTPSHSHQHFSPIPEAIIAKKTFFFPSSTTFTMYSEINPEASVPVTFFPDKNYEVQLAPYDFSTPIIGFSSPAFVVDTVEPGNTSLRFGFKFSAGGQTKVFSSGSWVPYTGTNGMTKSQMNSLDSSSMLSPGGFDLANQYLQIIAFVQGDGSNDPAVLGIRMFTLGGNQGSASIHDAFHLPDTVTVGTATVPEGAYIANRAGGYLLDSGYHDVSRNILGKIRTKDLGFEGTETDLHTIEIDASSTVPYASLRVRTITDDVEGETKVVGLELGRKTYYVGASLDATGFRHQVEVLFDNPNVTIHSIRAVISRRGRSTPT